jgi:tellurite resistance protein
VGTILCTAGLVVWLILTIRYETRHVRSRDWHRAHLDDPDAGPLVAYIPVVAILLAARFHVQLGYLAPWANAIFALALAVVCGQLIARWVSGGRVGDALHPGYFLPVVAGPFIASLGFTVVSEHSAAIAAFGAGVFFWVVLSALVFGRLMSATAASTPSLGIFLAPPATGGVAWFAANGGRIDLATQALAGILVVMLVVQILLIPLYRRTPFSLDFWAFSFPAASTANFAIRWAASAKFNGWQVFAWGFLGLASGVILWLCLASLRLEISRRLRVLAVGPQTAGE